MTMAPKLASDAMASTGLSCFSSNLGSRSRVPSTAGRESANSIAVSPTPKTATTASRRQTFQSTASRRSRKRGALVLICAKQP